MDENMTLSGAPPEEMLETQTDLEIPVMQENDKPDEISLRKKKNLLLPQPEKGLQ